MSAQEMGEKCGETGRNLRQVERAWRKKPYKYHVTVLLSFQTPFPTVLISIWRELMALSAKRLIVELPSAKEESNNQ